MRALLACVILLCLSGCESTRTTIVNFNTVPQHIVVAPPRPATMVAQQLRKLRVAEEASLISTTGHPQPLPTGICSAVVSLGPSGTVAGTPLVHCDNPALDPELTKAVFAAAPFPLPSPGVSQLHMVIGAMDLEPGVGASPPA